MGYDSNKKRIENSIIWKAKLEAIKGLLLIASVGILLILCGAVGLRYIFNMNVFGYVEVLTLLAIWLYFLGAIYASYEDSHLSADISENLIKSEKVKKVIVFIRHLLTVVIAMIFSYWIITEYAVWSIQQGGTTSGLKLPKTAYDMAMIAGVLLMSLYAVYHFVRFFKPLHQEKEGGK